MRLQWASAELEQLWQTRLYKIQDMMQFLEINSMVARQRQAAIVMLKVGSPQWYSCQQPGLVLLPFGIAKSQEYSNETVFPKEGEDVAVRALLSTERLEIPKTDEEWGHILGYPQCCIDFFKKDWVEQSHKDPLHGQLNIESAALGIPTSLTHNVSLRFVGVRPVFHLPCSFACEPTRAIALYLKEMALQNGYEEAYGWMETILKQKYTVSAKNGIGLIVHPFFRIIYDTDALDWSVTFTPQTVRPENGFDLFWKDNGFNNIFDMEQAHQEIINRVVLLEGIDSIVDLGAGNGYLVSKLGRLIGASKLFAIEVEADKCKRGRQMFPPVSFVHANIQAQTLTGPVDLVTVSDRRFEEGLSEGIVERLAGKYLLVYSYDGGLKKSGEFKGFHILSSSRNVVVHRRTL